MNESTEDDHAIEKKREKKSQKPTRKNQKKEWMESGKKITNKKYS